MPQMQCRRNRLSRSAGRAKSLYRRCGEYPRCRARSLYQLRQVRRRFSCSEAVGGCGRCRLQRCRKSQRLHPSHLHLSGGPRNAQEETYNSGRDPHASELLFVVGTRLRAVVCYKDDSLAFAKINLTVSTLRPGSTSNLYCAAIRESRLFLRIDALQTIRRLSFYVFSFVTQHSSGPDGRWTCQSTTR